jgi:hypothetical protein
VARPFTAFTPKEAVAGHWLAERKMGEKGKFLLQMVTGPLP